MYMRKKGVENARYALASRTAKVADLTTSHAQEQRSARLERVRV